MKTEPTTTIEKQETTQNEANASDAGLESASEEEGKTPAESTEGEAESEEGAESGTESEEEGYEQKVTRLAQSIAGKENATLSKTNTELRTRVTELETQLTDKVWDRELQHLFNEDTENLGEDAAKIRQSDRKLVAEQLKEFRQKSQSVEKLKEQLEAEISDKLPKLGIVERNQKARIDLWTLLFPEDKAKIAQVTTLLKKFEKANDWDDYELILEGIRETIKGKRKPFIPDSSQVSGSRNRLSTSPADKVTRGLNKLKKK